MDNFFKVELLCEGKRYEVDVNENADANKLAESFAKDIGLAEPNEYQIVLRGALRIKENSTLELIRKPTSSMHGKIKPVDSN